MAHNGAEMTHTLAWILFLRLLFASSYEESAWQEVAHNGSKLPLEVVAKSGNRSQISKCRNKTLQGMFAMLGYGDKAGSERLAATRHKEEGTPDITPEDSRHTGKQAYKTNPDWSAE